ncbi:2-dehydro-3-deoxygalactonokinase [Pseudomonas granadensis]|uniref:2-dehydro-3-deoxygalactonokinase n=1 Tax=Pseudomonas granadensis TaxID=1421430 RepID=UPI0019D22BA4|nr:2-dehydro-3-deoxygalactonokinase [Pseudomonas granadensis]MBN6775188.1 2-dehydro-3-deoxygalactonokinase [Pseudomonas granadensis]MBN6805999.1 2-dehydro-3-deoxygalactonokinase [Pseudomonas granadensis]MBN6833360.1 2-dehydro-3-deoxygalactonokinase [Pseudomonas granadensis]MBN6840636.1 2-dehydro-3-deoxygalactonokinase [Pseudomonas granadensis]MBN6869637.1 2-dehydro-3-deoxygalactonokinase [Pseudomonas granadensis]
MQAQLIALDWGTTSLRAYKLAADGMVLEQRALSSGIMQLPKTPRIIHGRECADGFELAFDQACGDWLDAQPDLPVIACGMVGSAQGWREAAYCETPADVANLGKSLQTVISLRGATVHIVPGVIQRSRLPNVMRGEETQVLGVLQQLPAEAGADLLIGLPGSHSKWVEVVDGCITHFDTFMTGEVFAVLSEHSILGRTQQPSSTFEAQAFDRGVQVALSADGELGVLSTVFSARTLGLTGELSPSLQADYLSGLMIGHELAALAAVQRQRRNNPNLPSIVLIGNGQLCARYSRALDACGFARVTLAEQATERGLWQLARAAGLIDSSSR